MACWEPCAGHPLCRLSDIGGKTEYEGEFVPYQPTADATIGRLMIDPVKTRRDAVFVHHVLVPLVALENGETLIPASEYEKGKRLLDREAQARERGR